MLNINMISEKIAFPMRKLTLGALLNAAIKPGKETRNRTKKRIDKAFRIGVRVEKNRCVFVSAEPCY